ncbi:hypothetical protein GCM10025331_31850 [Actinoplanes utahensis]|uniref:Uncharacterized protein n=1 Tax=Actinoplanes utahensis TaxID=1869 RepID=A0A0A6USW7_ACTUT|nr:hypothetical protein MB27_00935 [Actinoplanes utahensis]
MTRGLITACAGLVAGATFGAGPALAGGSTWYPQGHVLGYYGSMGGCNSYASTLALWADDFDCSYRPHWVAAQPYALIVQQPVTLSVAVPVVTQPDSGEDEWEAPAKPAPAVKEPEPEPAPPMKEPEPAAEPATVQVRPAVEEPVVKPYKKPKMTKLKPTATKPQKHVRATADDDEQCTTVVAHCADVQTVTLSTPVVQPIVRPIVPLAQPIVRPIVPLAQPVVPLRPLAVPFHNACGPCY